MMATIQRFGGRVSKWKCGVKAYLELKDGHDKRFDRWRNEKPIKKLLGKHVPAKDVSDLDALKFCQEMIRASAEMLPLIDTSPNHVGHKIDVALISGEKGFRWLFRDKQEQGPDTWHVSPN